MVFGFFNRSGGGGGGGGFQELFFRRFSKSIEKVAGLAVAATFFNVFEIFRFAGSFSGFLFPNHKRFFAQILKKLGRPTNRKASKS